jgi:hypothetical protein
MASLTVSLFTSSRQLSPQMTHKFDTYVLEARQIFSGNTKKLCVASQKKNYSKAESFFANMVQKCLAVILKELKIIFLNQMLLAWRVKLVSIL